MKNNPATEAIVGRLLLGIMLLATVPSSHAVEPASPTASLSGLLDMISGERMLAEVIRLSSLEFGGRRTGTEDDLASARYVAERMGSIGLQPGGSQPLPRHPFPVAWAMAAPVPITHIEHAPHLELSSPDVTITAAHGADFLPILDSPPVRVTAQVVFVGYGIADPARGYDDYAGAEVRDRLVLFLRGKPDFYPVPVSQAEKVRTAKDKGAVAFMTVTGPVISAYEAWRGGSSRPAGSYSQTDGERPLPGCWISTELAERLLGKPQRSLRRLQEELNGTSEREPFPLRVTATLSWDSAEATGLMINVLGIIPGAGPQAHETVIIGAHRDHLGRQGALFFPGADDNASGTAVILEAARVLGAAGLPPRRSLLFISFSGEEQGLLGSRLYVSRPARPLPATPAMINVDHAGVGNGRLTVGMTGVTKVFGQDAGTAAGIGDRLDLFGFFPGGDHVPFKEAGVPTITVVSSGPHPDFHQPTDTPDKVQPATLELAARYVLALVWKLAYEP
jgi:hypothetical protein